MKRTANALPFKILRFFCDDHYLEEIEGDLLELYDKRVEKNKPANLLLWLDILKLIRPKILKPLGGQKHNNMLKHHIKVSLRNFRRHRASFFINYIGLVGGLVTVLFIYLWVNHELSVDRFHEQESQIYRLVSDNGGSVTLLNTNPAFAKELEASIPEIEYVVNSAWGPLDSNLGLAENIYHTRGEFATDQFFQLFSYPLLVGHPSTVLDEPNAIVLSEQMALKLFKSTDVVGKQLDWRWYSMEESVIVTGVFKDLPTNSSEQFDYVLNFDVYEKRMGERARRGRNGRTFLKLAERASPQVVNQKIHDHTRATYPDYDGDPYFIIPFADYYLNSEYEKGKSVGGRIELVRLFIFIGLVILIIASVNFMNLSTARAALRTKEIGVRKTMGALKKSLIFQFLTEACIVSLLAGVTAIILLILLVPIFQDLLNHPLTLRFDLEIAWAFLLVIIVTGLLSGSYPALYLSSFSPIKVLKGAFSATSKDQWFRKGLVVFQFGTSLVLIVAVVVIYHQMRFVQTKSLGYQNEFIINVKTTGMNGEKQQAFLSEVRRIPGVIQSSGISHALFGAQKSGANISWEGKDPEQEVWFEYGSIDYGLLELLEVEMSEGRSFSRDYGSETTKVVINRATRDLMEVSNAVGEKLSVNEAEYEIIGVTEDFHFQSLHQKIGPTFFLLNRSGWYLNLAIKIDPGKMENAVLAIDDVYDKFNPGFPFEYSFHDQDQAESYQAEQKISQLTKFAAGLAIIISSLGLFGLVSFVTERKSKEMGIRKVLGASPIAIARSISKDFAGPIVIASIVGIAVSSVALNYWLSGFAYRIELKWWFFCSAVFLMVLIAALTSASQIAKAITGNPIETLRDE